MGKNEYSSVCVELFQNEKYFISPDVHTVIGYMLQWIDSTVMLETSCTDKELGAEIIKAATFSLSFEANQEEIENERQKRKGENTYWARLAGIKNWSSFVKKTEMVRLVFFPNRIDICRYFRWKNLSFGPISDGNVARFLGVPVTEELINKTKFAFPASATPDEIGKAVKTLFELEVKGKKI